jgi:hypothetical protein
MTVGAEVLSTLPAGAGFLEIGSVTRLDTARFSAAGLDGGYLQALRTNRVFVTYQ